MTDNTNVISFKRLGDKQRDGFKELFDNIDPEQCGVIIVLDHDPEDKHGDFQVVSNYEPTIRELIAMGVFSDWVAAQIYEVEEE